MKGVARLESHMKLYKVMEVPISVYGSEMWIVVK
jgi:hypothetical protein